ncbi:MAG TPA: HepT-like ribonuclease domain-containing protein [Spirillospora sp.]|nr:HepT-like ribonuclease domain-containing protein [Spirillospora sp.]
MQRAAVSFAAGRTRETLDADLMFAYAAVRAIEIVGEAAAHISQPTRDQLTSIPWHNIIGMRNRVVHDYLNVDNDIVWEVLTQNLPSLIAELERILSGNTTDETETPAPE